MNGAVTYAARVAQTAIVIGSRAFYGTLRGNASGICNLSCQPLNLVVVNTVCFERGISKMNRLNLIRLTLLAVLACAFVVSAQEATIVGTVFDPTGAAVPNVAITVTNTQTGQARTIKTSESGQYVVSNLNIGRYTVRAEAPGFKIAEQKDVGLQVGDRQRVDFKLEVGSATESISVEGTAVTVQTESGEVSDVITGQQITQLATNGRSIYSLALLTPGASGNMPDFQQPTPVGGDASVAFNGMRQNHNLWTIDGGEASDRGGAGGMDVMPSIDSIAEFRVLTSNYSAEYGLSSAATMTMAIKSGTSAFHAGCVGIPPQRCSECKRLLLQSRRQDR